MHTHTRAHTKQLFDMNNRVFLKDGVGMETLNFLSPPQYKLVLQTSHLWLPYYLIRPIVPSPGF